MKTEITFAAPAQVQVDCIQSIGHGGSFDVTFTDPGGATVTIKQIPRKRLAAVGLAIMAGLPPQNPARAGFQKWHDSLP